MHLKKHLSSMLKHLFLKMQEITIGNRIGITVIKYIELKV